MASTDTKKKERRAFPQELLNDIYQQVVATPDGELEYSRKVLVCPNEGRCGKNYYISVHDSSLLDMAATSRGVRTHMDRVAESSPGVIVSLSAQHCGPHFNYGDADMNTNPESPLYRTQNQDLVKHVKLDDGAYFVLVRWFHLEDNERPRPYTHALRENARAVKDCVLSFQEARTLTVYQKGGTAHYQVKRQVKSFAKLAEAFPHIERFVVLLGHCEEGLNDYDGRRCPHGNLDDPQRWGHPSNIGVWEAHARHGVCRILQRDFARIMRNLSVPVRLNLIEGPEPLRGNRLLCRAVFERA